MGEIQGVGDAEPELRVGDAERRAAMRALDAHLEAGRLDVEAYGDRSAAASVAVYRTDLAVLFVDLPAPHPVLPRRPGEPAVPLPAPVAGGGVARGADAGAAPAPHVGPVEGMAFGLVIMLMFAVPAIVATGAPIGALLLLPLVVLLAGGTVGGAARRRRGGHGGHTGRDEG